MEKLIVIFDRDGVINELNQKVAETVGVLYELFQHYKIEANPHFSEDVKKAIYQCYKDPQIFADVEPTNGYMEIARLKKDKRVHLVMNSLSTSHIIAEVKREWDKKHGITFFDEYRDCFGQKKQMQAAFIQVEDCLDNIFESPAQYKILIDRPYNQGNIPANTFRVYGLPEAVDVIERILKTASLK